VADWDCV
ncbi:araC-like ligand binding domain protein, partial [Vibrio parahaemolyticus VPTS-2010_2]